MPIDTHDPIDDPGTDELALPRFEERLRERLLRAHDERLVVPATTPGRRRARRSLTLGAAVLGAAAAVVVAVAVRPSGDGGGVGPDVTAADGDTAVPPTSELVPQVIAAIDEAASTSVVHITQDNDASGDGEGWIDETTGAGRSLQHGLDGGPLFDSSGRGDDTLTVDHCFSEYAEDTVDFSPRAGSATAWVQNYLADGRLVEDGTEIVGGRELIRLREVPYSELGPDAPPARRLRERAEAAADAVRAARAADPPLPATELARLEAEAAFAAARLEVFEMPSSGESEPAVTLVDPDTYRPVRVVDPGLGYTQDYEYLPRTPENLALLDAVVPPGFTRVDQIRGDGERADAGCR